MKELISKKNFATLGALITWSAVILQLYLILNNRQVSLSDALIKFFSFFTILTNILVALSFTAVLSNADTFFTKTKTLTAVVVYITIVGITYNLILRGLLQLNGMNRVADETLHVIVPILFILFWFFFVPKEKISWVSFLPWLWYPGLYLIYVLIRGHFTGLYPYPFVNAADLGYSKALINSSGVCAAIVIVSLLFITISRTVAAKNNL